MDTFKGPGYGIARLKAEHSDNNYSYVVWCEETSECVVIDPNDPGIVLGFVRDNGLSVRYIVNTHGHPDHTLGNDPILKVTLSKILIHELGMDLVSPRSAPLKDGDAISFGRLELKAVHTPGHCPEHMTLLIGEDAFTGDTLFLSGVGNLKHGGVARDLFRSIDTILRKLPASTRVFPGHDYSDANLRFALDVEPGNKDARKRLDGVTKDRRKCKEPAPSTIGDEMKYNPFMRYDVAGVAKGLKDRNPDMDASPISVFTELRKLRDDWK